MLETKAEHLVRSSLTPRERQILHLAALRGTDYSIAYHLGISHETVKHHLANIADKLVKEGLIDSTVRHRHSNSNSGNRSVSAVAAVAALEHGLIPPIPLDALMYLYTQANQALPGQYADKITGLMTLAADPHV